MKNYKEYEQSYIGDSDIASLILVGMKPEEEYNKEKEQNADVFVDAIKTSVLHFGGDRSYNAYIVDEEAEIGSHYELEAEFEYWIKIYDDFEVTFEAYAKKIKIYRARNYGCIIQLIENNRNRASYICY